MNRLAQAPALLAATLLVSTGCSASPNAQRSQPSSTHQPSSNTPSAVPGGPSPSPDLTTGLPVSPFAQAICSQKIQSDLSGTLGYSTVSRSSRNISDLHKCTYQLPVGRFVLSVNQSPDKTSAREYFNSLRRRLSPTRPIRGLGSFGLPSFQTTDGRTVFLHDRETLAGDSTDLPQRVGKYHQSRSDLSFLITSRVIYPDA